MTIAITIPVWLLWTLGLIIGIPALVALIVLIVLGLDIKRSMDRWWGW